MLNPKTRRAFATHKTSGKKFILCDDTVRESLKAHVLVKDYEKKLVMENPHLNITFKVVNR